MSVQNKQTGHSSDILPTFLYSLAFFIFGFIVYLIWTPQHFDLTFSEFIKNTREYIYISFQNNFNIFVMGRYGQTNMLIPYYIFLVSTMILAAIHPTAIVQIFKKGVKISRAKVVMMIAFIGLFVFTEAQQICRIDKLDQEGKKVHDKNDEEKNSYYFKEIFEFTKVSREVLKNRSLKGQTLTDISIGDHPYESYFRILAYHIFPQVRLRYDDNKDTEALILFFKNNPMQSIPEDFEIIVMSNNGILGLAIKKSIK